MATKDKQDALLNAIQNEETLNLLYDCWALLQHAPSRAVEILMQFKDVSSAAKVATADIQEALARWDALKPRIKDLQEMSERVKEFNRQVAATNEDTVLNRLNRIVNVAEKVEDLKKSGGLNLIERLLKKEG